MFGIKSHTMPRWLKKSESRPSRRILLQRMLRARARDLMFLKGWRDDLMERVEGGFSGEVGLGKGGMFALTRPLGATLGMFGQYTSRLRFVCFVCL